MRIRTSITEHLTGIVQKAESDIKLEHGFATIPLPGIDSLPLPLRLGRFMPFRACKRLCIMIRLPREIYEADEFYLDLLKKINPAHLDPGRLVGKYVPNLVAKPIEVTREYAQLIYDQTLSPRLVKVLRKWDSGIRRPGGLSNNIRSSPMLSSSSCLPTSLRLPPVGLRPRISSSSTISPSGSLRSVRRR